MAECKAGLELNQAAFLSPQDNNLTCLAFPLICFYRETVDGERHDVNSGIDTDL
jgi:hypothetical protein